jgi:hypothetical protein
MIIERICMLATEIRSIIEWIAEYEHMGKICSDAHIDMKLNGHALNLYWDAEVDGKVVRQAAFFKFTGIQLGGE